MSDQLPNREVIASPPWCLEHDAQVIEGPLAHQFNECWKQVYAEGSVELCRVVSGRLVDREAIDYEAGYDKAGTIGLPRPFLLDDIAQIVDAAIGDTK